MKPVYKPKTCCQQTEQLGDGNWATTWHNKKMWSDAVDFISVMSKWMAINAGTYVSMGNNFKLAPYVYQQQEAHGPWHSADKIAASA